MAAGSWTLAEELFAREEVPGWTQWGDELETYAENRTVAAGYRGD